MTTEENKSGQEFAIQKLYVTDLSFEAPASENPVNKPDWKPEMNLDLHTQTRHFDDDNHEVVLTVTVTVKTEDKTAFIAEVKQAGLFRVKGLSEEQLRHTLGSFCPNILYPYAREVITNTISRAGFPQLILAPVNFDALYAEHVKQGESSG